MTKKKTDPVAERPPHGTFQVHVRPEGPYRVCTLSVVARRRTDAAAAVRNCRTADEKARAERLHEALDHHFADLPDAAALRLAWLEREEDGSWVACAPDVDAGETYRELHRGLELLEKVGNAVRRHLGKRTITDETFSDPAVVVAALRRCRVFVEVERFESDGLRYWIETCPALAEGAAA